MKRDSLQLWVGYPDDLLKGGAVAQCAALLSQEDHIRCQRFKFDRHRRESLTTRALLRNALSHGSSVPPNSWRFTTNRYGKPALEPDCGLRFNTSNSIGLVVCLITEAAELGVDVEPLSRAREILDLAAEVFSAAERAQLMALALEKRLDRAISLWTLKEAYVKARGLGLAIPLDKFSFLFEPDGNIRLATDHATDDQVERWRFFLLNHAGHRIASVVERSSTEDFQMLEARPAAVAPALLDGFAIQWYPRESLCPSVGPTGAVPAGSEAEFAVGPPVRQ